MVRQRRRRHSSDGRRRSRRAERVVGARFTTAGALPEHPFDAMWSAPGLLELVEGAMLTDEERELVFDLGAYVAGWAGLCHEPSVEQPGPFGCTSIPACMERFRENPEVYWRLAGEGCGEEN